MTKELEKNSKSLLEEFKDFLREYKVLGLAVAFIMAIYLGSLVQALVNDLIMPLIELLPIGQNRWYTITFSFGQADFLIGHFIGQLITFIIIALVIFLIVKIAKKYNIE